MTECTDLHSSQRWLTSDSSGHRKGWYLGEGLPVLEGVEKLSLLHGTSKISKSVSSLHFLSHKMTLKQMTMQQGNGALCFSGVGPCSS